MKFEECLAFVQSAEAGFVVGGYDGDDVRAGGGPLWGRPAACRLI